MSRLKTYVVFSDCHIPYEDKALFNAACELISDIRPDGIILNGDILDLIEISRHNKGSVAQLEGKRIVHTFDAANKFLDQIDYHLTGNCALKVFTFGNHEDRYNRWLLKDDNSVWQDDEINSIHGRLNLKQRGYKWHSNYPEAHVMLGKLLVTHGSWANQHCAKKHLDEYQTSCLVGHTHTQQTYHGSTWEGQRVAHCAGFMGDPDSEAFKYKHRPRRWIQGFTVVHVRPNGDFHIVPVNWVSGCFMYGSQIYPKRVRK